MQTDSDILTVVQQAFCHCPKPEHFTDYGHCEECREHDDTLRVKTVETLTRDDVRHSGWDPLCFTSPEGIAYLFQPWLNWHLRGKRRSSTGTAVSCCFTSLMMGNRTAYFAPLVDGKEKPLPRFYAILMRHDAIRWPVTCAKTNSIQPSGFGAAIWNSECRILAKLHAIFASGSDGLLNESACTA